MSWPPALALQPRPGFYLHPGQLFASRGPCEVTTILGTCVAVCLWDPEARIGGVNHYLLPYPVGDEDASLRYGHTSIPRLIDSVIGLGADGGRLRAKLFGGMSSKLTSRSHDLGEANVKLAQKLLRERKIRIGAQDVGGPRGRRLLFEVADGTARVKLL